MPKFTPKPKLGIIMNWLLEVTKHDEHGRHVYNSNGTLQKVKVQMCDADFNGQPHPLYFPEGHYHAGIFKGMATILEEQGYKDVSKLKAKCKGFKCTPPALDCCCHHLLFNQPDFVHVESILKVTCKAQGFQVIFLPKFHCELNFIDQCWGYAKWIYHLNPESSREDHLKKNALAALDAVPLESMCW
jgi:hypothetical protein